jgi:RimJ/RimL family protein N-acetyltransferase
VFEPVISTKRLELHHIPVDGLISLFEEKSDLLAIANRSFTNPLNVLINESGPLAWRVPQVKEDSRKNKWFVRFIVLGGEIIGSTSFHGEPDESGMIEIGLGIEEPFQNQGFAKEALRGMWLWASQFPEVKSFRYTVSPENIPSIKVIKTFEFPYMGQQIDEIDGPEDIYEMSVEEFLKKWGNRHDR